MPTVRSYWAYSKDNFRCWICHNEEIPLELPGENEEKRIACSGCGAIFVVSNGYPTWGRDLLTAGRIDSLFPGGGADNRSSAIRTFLDAWDNNAPVSDAIQALRDSLGEASGEEKVNQG